MAQPTFYSDGNTPRRTDPRLRKWKKILGARQDALGGAANAANNPRSTDPLNPTLKKLNAALVGA